MEIIITDFFNYADPFNYSASCAELGDNAGRITWRAAQDADFNLLDNDDKLEAMRAWATSSGGWDDAEIAAWSDNDLNALFIQLISGDIREFNELCGSDWDEYQSLSDDGVVGGNLFVGVDKNIYYYLG